MGSAVGASEKIFAQSTTFKSCKDLADCHACISKSSRMYPLVGGSVQAVCESRVAEAQEKVAGLLNREGYLEAF